MGFSSSYTSKDEESRCSVGSGETRSDLDLRGRSNAAVAIPSRESMCQDKCTAWQAGFVFLSSGCESCALQSAGRLCPADCPARAADRRCARRGTSCTGTNGSIQHAQFNSCRRLGTQTHAFQRALNVMQIWCCTRAHMARAGEKLACNLRHALLQALPPAPPAEPPPAPALWVAAARVSVGVGEQLCRGWVVGASDGVCGERGVEEVNWDTC